ncbi:MAG: hypothetical protein WC091_09625 [Sulfuricellaceae bacterium]
MHYLPSYDSFFTADGITIVELDAAVIDLATALRARHNLRTPDALQAASCLVRQPGAPFICLARGELSGLDCSWRDAMQGANCAAWSLSRKQFATRQCARQGQSNRTISPAQGINADSAFLRVKNLDVRLLNPT